MKFLSKPLDEAGTPARLLGVGLLLVLLTAAAAGRMEAPQFRSPSSTALAAGEENGICDDECANDQAYIYNENQKAEGKSQMTSAEMLKNMDAVISDMDNIEEQVGSAYPDTNGALRALGQYIAQAHYLRDQAALNGSLASLTAAQKAVMSIHKEVVNIANTPR